MSSARGSQRAFARSGASRLRKGGASVLICSALTVCTLALASIANSGSTPTAPRPKGFPAQKVPKDNPITAAKA
ncbi:MAG TPA: hypothetical protein PKB03_03125, partial [Baekduia sp.]|nr:hypothetical protein [Baekduia sp.]